jgi:uncharacterized protein YbaR (Trm112 family)
LSDVDNLNLISCPSGHLHCNGCDEIIPVGDRLPILLIPVVHTETGDKAFAAVCPDCAIPLLLEGISEAKARRQRQHDSLN